MSAADLVTPRGELTQYIGMQVERVKLVQPLDKELEVPQIASFVETFELSDAIIRGKWELGNYHFQPSKSSLDGIALDGEYGTSSIRIKCARSTSDENNHSLKLQLDVAFGNNPQAITFASLGIETNKDGKITRVGMTLFDAESKDAIATVRMYGIDSGAKQGVAVEIEQDSHIRDDVAAMLSEMTFETAWETMTDWLKFSIGVA